MNQKDVPPKVLCPNCLGSCEEPNNEGVECKDCNGMGWVRPKKKGG